MKTAHYYKLSVCLCILGALLINSSGSPSALSATSGYSSAKCGKWNVTPSPNVKGGISAFSGVAAISATDIWTVGYNDQYDPPLIEHWNGTNWQVVPSPSPGIQGNQLYGITAISANNIWAVGNYTSHKGVSRTLIEHWNGTTWSVVPSPTPHSYGVILNSVAAVSTNDVWAVGSTFDPYGPYQTLIEHWNGHKWSIVPSPNPGPTGNSLSSVAAVSATNIWAVGSYTNNNSIAQTLIEHWNGTRWQAVSSPNPGPDGNHLSAVSVVSNNDIWAAGYYYPSGGYPQTLIEQWNGSNWNTVPSPSPGSVNNQLSAVAATSASDIWAAGYYDNSGSNQQTLLEHWNGTSWQIVPSPNLGPNGNILSALTTVSTNDIWTVGYYNTNNNSIAQTLVEHWNGTSWQVVSSPNAGTTENALSSVAAVSATNIWAVGSYINRISRVAQPLIEHWNGTSWQIIPSPNSGIDNYSSNKILYGVSADSATDIWAVGYYNDIQNSNFYQTLVEHWNGTYWQVVPSPNQGSTDNVLSSVTAVSSNDAWAVGSYGDPSQTLTEHWNGTNWQIVPSPGLSQSNNYLNGVAAISAGNIWAVGDAYNSNISVQQTLIEHWNGTNWQIVPSPNPSTDDTLSSVAAVSANAIWAVGYYNTNGIAQTLIEQWNGSSWSIVPSPNPVSNGDLLSSVAAASPTNIWAVGYHYTNIYGLYQTLIEHWNGTNWQVIPSPNPGPKGNILSSVAAASANGVWSVGNYANLGYYHQTLTEFYC